MDRPLLFLIAAITFLLAPPSYAAVPTTQPTWAELTPQQKLALAPLAGEWDKMESYRRRKWLGIAARYPTMKPEEQQRVQQKMKDWTNLTPEERRIAREKFMALRHAPPEKREAVKQKWQEYDKLPEDEKQRLKQEAVRKPNPKTAIKSRPLPVRPKPLTTAPTPATPAPAP